MPLSPQATTFNPAASTSNNPASVFVPRPLFPSDNAHPAASAPLPIPKGGAWGAGGQHSASMKSQVPQPAPIPAHAPDARLPRPASAPSAHRTGAGGAAFLPGGPGGPEGVVVVVEERDGAEGWGGEVAAAIRAGRRALGERRGGAGGGGTRANSRSRVEEGTVEDAA
ncbi:hypothetical protein T484DRAFT_1903717, partial [Baffinella frigidus]